MLAELRNVAKEFPAPQGPAVVVLRDINLAISQGQSLALVGPSGSGKTTLLNILGTLDRPSRGQVFMDGKDLLLLSQRELAAIRNRQVGFVFQMHHLLPQCTVLENVLVPTIPNGADRDANDRALALLQRVGLGDMLSYRPGQLSAGQCQRVAIARALINHPYLVLADEPTGSLDRAAGQQVAELLCQLNAQEGTALVVATHSTELAGRMQRTCLLRDGVLES